MDYKGIMEKPFFTLSVRTRGGSLLEQSQDTPPGVFSNGVMTSDQTLVLTTPISEFPQGQPCLFCDAMYGHKATGCHMLSCVVDAEAISLCIFCQYMQENASILHVGDVLCSTIPQALGLSLTGDAACRFCSLL